MSPYMLKCRMPYAVKKYRKFHLESAEATCGKLRIVSERKGVLKKVIHCRSRDFHKILGDYLVNVMEMTKALLRDFI